MGTNYYIRCKECKMRIYHIGKQSYGWNFKSNITKKDFLSLKLEKYQEIVDEYGRLFTKERMLEKVTDEWELQEDAEDWFNAGDNGWC